MIKTTAGLSAFTNDYLLPKADGPKCDLALGTKRAKAITLMLMGLPGSMYIYQWVFTPDTEILAELRGGLGERS